MTNDSLKSLGYLRKSLKMSRYALEKNMVGDGADAGKVLAFQTKIDELIKEIDILTIPEPAKTNTDVFAS